MGSKTLIIIILTIAVIGNCAMAQRESKKLIITGTVMNVSDSDFIRSPVVNASILIDGFKTNSVTDSSGNYRVKVDRDATKIGIFTISNGLVEELIDRRTEINFNFINYISEVHLTPQQTDPAPGEEGVNTGYNHIKKKDLTTQISNVDISKRKHLTYSSIYEMIRIENPGIKVNGDRIIIQDSKDFKLGSIPALLIVDGVPVESIESITPSSVESITVLKGTSAAIYGSRGYGGAVVIKTRIKND